MRQNTIKAIHIISKPSPYFITGDGINSESPFFRGLFEATTGRLESFMEDTYLGLVINSCVHFSGGLIEVGKVAAFAVSLAVVSIWCV